MNFDHLRITLVVAVTVVAVSAACLGQAGSPVEPGKPLPILQSAFNNCNKGYSLSKSVFQSNGRPEYHAAKIMALHAFES